MEKQQFHILVENYTSLSAEEAQLLISLEQEYPFSQVVHTLAARATQDNQLAEGGHQLHLAAMYTTDRSVLKTIMTAAVLERKSGTYIHQHTEESEKIKEEVLIKPAEISQETSTQEVTLEKPEESVRLIPVTTGTDDSIYEEVIHDLERLKFLKHEFEEAFKRLESGTSPAAEIIESVPDKKKKITDPNEELLDEIKSSKKKIKPEGPKQKEQIEIIDQFIKTQPSIKGKVVSETKESEKTDLSKNSEGYSENIISETLAQILIKQGKKEKAIEVLKKLIWKFPQKKAYFAAQIEDLKK